MAMRRQRRIHHYEDDDSTYICEPVENYEEGFLPMDRLKSQASQHRFENTIEIKVKEDDTLQALALKFHCTIADIKRLNKIDKDNEIYARKVIKIPVTVQSVLLGVTPHTIKNDNSSPRHLSDGSTCKQSSLNESQAYLKENLLVASVSALPNCCSDGSINSIILNSEVSSNLSYANDDFNRQHDVSEATSTLLDVKMPQPRPIRGPALHAIDWSGTDCDMSWACLFIVILALCFVIPLVYIIYMAERPHHNMTAH